VKPNLHLLRQPFQTLLLRKKNNYKNYTDFKETNKFVAFKQFLLLVGVLGQSARKSENYNPLQSKQQTMHMQ
jgi:hypothetical protein